jgi:hypothetical protein
MYKLWLLSSIELKTYVTIEAFLFQENILGLQILRTYVNASVLEHNLKVRGKIHLLSDQTVC